MKERIRRSAVLCVAVIGLISACSSTTTSTTTSASDIVASTVIASASPPQTEPLAAEPSDTATTVTPVEGVPYDQRLALRAVREAHPDADLVAIKTSTKGETKVVAFTVREPSGKSVRMTLDWTTGEVLSTTSVKTPRLARKALPDVPALDALEESLAQVSAAVFKSLKLESRKGKTVWVIKVDSSTGPHTFRIDAEQDPDN